MEAELGLSPKLRRDAQRNHERIVDAARELFRQRGIDISLDDIARHAGVGVATAYRHFPEKEQLIDAVFADDMARTVALAVEAASQERAWDGIVLWFGRVAEMQADDAGLRALMKSRSRGGAHAQEAHDQIAKKLTELLRRARAEGDLRRDLEISDVAVCNYMLGAAIDLTDPVSPGAWRRYLGLLLDGMRSERAEAAKLAPRALSRDQLEQAMSS